jgi:transcription-repair coupling factor (superfamily II helicase)
MFDSLELFVGQHIDLETVLKRLAAYRYTKVDKTYEEGQFALRGGVLDVYPVNFEGPLRIDVDDDLIKAIASVNIHTGRSIWQHKAVIILPLAQTSRKEVFSAEVPMVNFIDIEEGDYVVHNQHGIGRFVGLKELSVADKRLEHLVIEYRDGDRLFVPKHDLRLVQKYVSFNKKPPRLFKLGSKEWEKVRNAIQKKLQKLAAELLHIHAARASMKGFAFSKDTDWQEEFDDTFEFEETPDQLKAWEEVKRDMETGIPMDRLICGDVGYGKTEVAIRAVFKAVMDNKQAAVLVPTTILAEQHYYNFKKRFKGYPVSVAMLSRFRTKHEQGTIIKGLAEGKVDVVIGTHRLISSDIAFKDLALIVIDEEQRFGVRAKEKLKHLKILADCLTLTATPIPRTLYMALAGAKDMSVITTPPQKRIPVNTRVIEFDENIIRRAIAKELARGGQVFFLHNRVEDIELIAKIIKKIVPQARVAVAHGQMPGRLLEEIMLHYLEGAVDVLICTTIIGSGIDIPNANTLIVNRADHFGLSELHQLRGRVGRASEEAFAYFIAPQGRRMSDIAKKRIDTLLKYSQLGAGFHIAFEDMQLRGAGNLLGREQSGYIASVGFDLYCRLLRESIENLKQTKEFDHEKSKT